MDAGKVALLAEGVDRNATLARRVRVAAVALLAEGVDRNTYGRKTMGDMLTSPSSRRAWIEILCRRKQRGWRRVALLAEGVDRNFARELLLIVSSRRPPRGGRG